MAAEHAQKLIQIEEKLTKEIQDRIEYKRRIEILLDDNYSDIDSD